MVMMGPLTKRTSSYIATNRSKGTIQIFARKWELPSEALVIMFKMLFYLMVEISSESSPKWHVGARSRSLLIRSALETKNQEKRMRRPSSLNYFNRHSTNRAEYSSRGTCQQHSPKDSRLYIIGANASTRRTTSISTPGLSPPRDADDEI